MKTTQLFILLVFTIYCSISKGFHFNKRITGVARLANVNGYNNFSPHQVGSKLRAAGAEISKDAASVTNTASNADKPPYAMNIQQNVYLVLTNLFVTCLIVADVIGVKIFNLPLPFKIFGHQNIHHTCGMLSFPITFLLSDIINEYYGVQATKKTVYLGLVMSVFVFGIINLAQALPYLHAPFNVTPFAFDMIFGSAKVMYIASLIAYLAGQMTDIWIYAAVKRITKGKLLWLRAASSTMISQLLDSFVVTYFAYNVGKTMTGQIPATLKEVWNISLTGYGLKFFIAAAITPLLYLARDIMQNKFKLEPMPIEVTKSH